MTLALITKGFRFGGRLLQLDDDTLADATADAWAIDLTGKPYPFDAQDVDRHAVQPDSMRTFLEKVDGTSEPPPPPPPPEEA